MTTTIDMTKIVEKANELSNDIVKVQRELKRIASVKCRLKKAPGRSDYNANMAACLQEEQLLKNVRDYLTEPHKTVNTITQEDVDKMSYDEVCAAIRCIQSKKTHTKWAEDCERNPDGTYIPESGAMYKEACRIEDMLKDRRDQIKPVESNRRISRVKLQELIDTLRLCSDLDVETCLDRIEAFMEGGES